MKKLFQFVYTARYRVVFAASSFLAASSALAQAQSVPTVPVGFDKDDLSNVLADFIGYILVILGGVAVLVILYAGYLFMTAGGDEKKLQQAKSALKWGIVGIAVSIFAGSAVALIGRFLGAQVAI